MVGFRITGTGLGPGGYSYLTFDEIAKFTASAGFGGPDLYRAQYGVRLPGYSTLVWVCVPCCSFQTRSLFALTLFHPPLFPLERPPTTRKTNTAPGRVMEVIHTTPLADPVVEGTITLNPGEDYLLSAVSDGSPTTEGARYTYFGTGTAPGKVVRVQF